MRCERVREKLSAFVDGELSENEHRGIASHLESCESCFREYEELKKLEVLLSNLERVDAPSYLWERIVGRISSQERVSSWEKLIHRLVYAPVGVAILIGLLIGNHLGQTVLQQFASDRAEPLSLGSLDDFPPGSFSDVYFNGWEE